MTPTKTPASPAPVVKRVLQMSIYGALAGLILFGCAGSAKWLFGWLWLVFMFALQVIGTIGVGLRHPDLLEERAHMPKDMKWWDRILTPVLMLSTVGIYCVAGLDYRFHGGRPPIWLVALAMLMACAGGAITAAAMMANRFFATTVRIQSERGHTVVSTGPYARIRHPGYAGVLLFTAAAPAALGSRLAFIPAFVAIVAIALRTALEDRTLRDELPGYGEYAQRVRWRLIPGVW